MYIDRHERTEPFCDCENNYYIRNHKNDITAIMWVHGGGLEWAMSTCNGCGRREGSCPIF